MVMVNFINLNSLNFSDFCHCRTNVRNYDNVQSTDTPPDGYASLTPSSTYTYLRYMYNHISVTLTKCFPVVSLNALNTTER